MQWRIALGIVITVFLSPLTFCTIASTDEPTKPTLYDAADRGELEAVKRLLASGVKPDDQRNKFGSTALMRAGFRGNLEMMTFLIAQGADVNAEDNGLVDLIEGRRANSVLDDAADGGHLDATALLVEKGANVNHKGIFGMTPLHHAIEFGGSRANHDGGGSKEISKLLLDKGADVNAKCYQGHTALMLAVSKGNQEIVELLIENGADVNTATEAGGTAIMSAVNKGREHIVELLIAKGADVNAKGRDGSTSLKIAKRRLTQTGREVYNAITRTLVAHGASE
jgi:ankyrin repeat protein